MSKPHSSHHSDPFFLFKTRVVKRVKLFNFKSIRPAGSLKLKVFYISLSHSLRLKVRIIGSLIGIGRKKFVEFDVRP